MNPNPDYESSAALSIGQLLQQFLRRREPRYLVAAMGSIWREGRLAECFYSGLNFLWYRPSRLSPVRPTAASLVDILRESQGIPSDQECQRFVERLRADHGLDITYRSHIARVGEHWIAGEYTDRGKRLFVWDARSATIRVSNYYDQFPAVRHIHLVLGVGGNSVAICTGDSAKFLDIFELSQGELLFRKRLLKRVGGFTAGCQIGDDHYFGSDFWRRPNYLFRLRDRRKFFLPMPCYLMYVQMLYVFEDRYVFGQCADLWNLDRTGCFLFDTQTESFVDAAVYQVRSLSWEAKESAEREGLIKV